MGYEHKEKTYNIEWEVKKLFSKRTILYSHNKLIIWSIKEILKSDSVGLFEV